MNLVVIFIHLIGFGFAQEQTPKVRPSDSELKKVGFYSFNVGTLYSHQLGGIDGQLSSWNLGSFSLKTEVGANDNIAFETGFVFLNQEYHVSNSAYALEQSVTRMIVPLNVK